MQTSSPNRGVQGLAAGLFERAQAAGLDRTLLNTVADIRVRLASQYIV
jgi:TBC1 domain family protein 5